MATARQRHIRGIQDGPTRQRGEPAEAQRDQSAQDEDDRFGALGAEMADLLRSAHAAAEAERARAREEADAIRAEAQAEADGIRDTARAEATAQISAATGLREAAERAVQEAQEQNARLRAQLEAEQQRVARELEAEQTRVAGEVSSERADARTAIENVIEGLRAALDRLEGDDSGDAGSRGPTGFTPEPTEAGPAGGTTDADTDDVEAGEPEPTAGQPDGPDTAQSDDQGTEGLSSAVRAAITMAFGPKADTPT